MQTGRGGGTTRRSRAGQLSNMALRVGGKVSVEVPAPFALLTAAVPSSAVRAGSAACVDPQLGKYRKHPNWLLVVFTRMTDSSGF